MEGEIRSACPTADAKPIVLHGDGLRSRIVDKGGAVSSQEGGVFVAPAAGTAADGSGGGSGGGGVFMVAMVLT